MLAPTFQRARILSLDGGGIYGLTGAILLRKLCERNPEFLQPDPNTFMLFAGTSSGAINALLMAREANPRQLLLSGALERFWHDPRIFTPGLPTSKIGLTSFYLNAPFIEVLHEHFGELKLRDLEAYAQVSTFNWTGASDRERQAQLGGTEPHPDHFLASAYRPSGPNRMVVRSGQPQQHWKPKFFDNITKDEPLELQDPDNDYDVSFVAYAATAPPGFRALFHGIGDGGSFNANPSVPALSRTVSAFRVMSGERPLQLLHNRRALAFTDDEGQHDEAQHDEGQHDEGQHGERVGRILDKIVLLSVGSGQILPHYGFNSSNFGALPSMLLPTNLRTGALFPPPWYSLDPASEESDHIINQLLPSDHSLRLNPPLNPIPTIAAALMARSTLLRTQLLQSIRSACESDAATHAIDHASRFIQTQFSRS